MAANGAGQCIPSSFGLLTPLPRVQEYASLSHRASLTHIPLSTPLLPRAILTFPPSPPFLVAPQRLVPQAMHDR